MTNEVNQQVMGLCFLMECTLTILLLVISGFGVTGLVHHALGLW
jgi:hypothetical protein